MTADSIFVTIAGTITRRTATAFFFSSRRRHTRWPRDWSSDVCSSDLQAATGLPVMRGVVTGGSGFLGSHVADVLAERGHDVTVVDVSPTHRHRWVAADLLDRDALAAAFREIGRASCRERVEICDGAGC